MTTLSRWLLPLALVLTACIEKQATVRLKVEVKTNQGDPVAAAVVALDGKALGETNNMGGFSTEIELPTGAKKRLEVKKDSETYYFAPYYEGFVVGDSTPQDLAFTATLYFVPKPTQEGAKPEDKPVATVTPATPASPDAAAAAGAAAGAPDALAAANAPGSSTLVDTAPVVAPPTTPDAPSVAPAPIATTVEATPPAATPPPATAAVNGPPPPAVTTATPPPSDEVVANAPVGSAKPTPEEAAAALDEDDAEIPASVPATATPKPTAVAVAPVPAPETMTPDAKAAAGYPKGARTNQGQTVFTVHVFAGEQPVADAEVLLGEEQASDLKTACKTNVRGRCVVRFAEKPEGPVTFVATKKGFKTASVTAPVKDKGTLKLTLDHGHTIDIYALTRSYNQTIGLKEVEVYVAGKRVGETDRFGRYSHVYDGKIDDLLAISLKPKGFLPEAFETDFVASGPMTLVKYFTPDQPPAVRMAVLPPAPAGAAGKDALAKLDASFDEALRTAARTHLYSSSAFKELPLAAYEKAVQRSGKTPLDVLRTGWQDTEMKATVDAVLIPTVVLGAKTSLELSVVDSTGRILAAAKEELEGAGDKTSVDRAVAAIAKKITRAFPFEGAVLSKDADKVLINLGSGLGRGVKVGDVIDVYGVQAEKLGRSQLHGKIAALTVKEVTDQTAKCSVGKLVPRATIERGDLVVLRPRKAPEGGGAQLKVLAGLDGKGKAVGQANVYFNDFWIGATDEMGRLYLDITGNGTLKIIKQGFEDFTKPVAVSKQSRLEAALKREAAFLRVDSKPQGATVKVDGKVLGKTPLATPIAVPTGFVKLELEPPAGFKAYSQVLELDQGTLDLTGEASIAFEQDYRATAQAQLKAGKTDEALATLNAIPKEHSDYLLGRHDAGEIYLTTLDQPAKAAEAFALVTSNEAVKQFADKRFIGSHVNEGIALFLTAERLAAEKPEAARAHYQKALDVLEAVVPHLRFVPSDQYAQAVHNVDYHRALCRHRLWVASQDPRMLAETVKTWKSYLDGSARSIPAIGTSKTYVENAEIYYKQAMASMSAARSVSKQ